MYKKVVEKIYGRVIKLALDLVLKTSGTFGYGDRYLTLPQKRRIN